MKRKIISTLLVISMLLAACASIFAGAATTTYPFTDVPGWASDKVQVVYEKGIMSGTGGNNFGSTMEFTREQMVKTLYNMAKADVTATKDDLTSVFADGAKVSSWAVTAVKWAIDNGITSGIEEKGQLYFKPQKALSRAEAATFIISYLKYSDLPTTGEITKTFEDEGSLSWASAYVKGCVGLGIINGISENGKLYFKPTKTLTRIEAAVMLALTTKVEPAKPLVNTDPKDPNPTSLGEINYNGATLAEGLKISQASLVTDGTTNNKFTATGNGNHGWVESRVARNENGTYIVISNDEFVKKEVPYNGGTAAVVYGTFVLVKVTSDGYEEICTGEYPVHQGSCSSNVLVGSNGMIYVTTFSNDWEYYYTQDKKDAAFLNVYQVDTNTNTLVSSGSVVLPFKVGGVAGYGYYQPILDEASGKIYGLFSGGEAPGCLSWFIYDLKTKTWETANYWFELPYRSSYHHAYPDGNGGIFFVSQRNAPSDKLSIADGVTFDRDGYLFDALYLYHIPNMYEEEVITVDKVYEPQYKRFPKDPVKGTVAGAGAAHYCNGTTYLASNGYLYVVYTKAEKGTSGYYCNIYDTTNNFKSVRKNVTLNFLSSIGSYQFAVKESASGAVYLTAIDDTTGKVEIYQFDVAATGKAFLKSMITDGSGNATSVQLTVKGSGSNMATCHRLSYTSTRNGSLQDSVLGLVTQYGSGERKLTMTAKDAEKYRSCIWSYGESTYNFYYYSIQFPE